MSDRLPTDAVQRLLRLLAAKLEDHLEGDELAFETLSEALEEEGFGGEDLASVAMALRSLAGAGPSSGWVAGSPGRRSQRVLSQEERAFLSTEAWGYLLDLKAQGVLDPAQFERVLDGLAGIGVRPVDVELAREIASRVALEVEDGMSPGDTTHGDIEIAH